MLWLPVWVHHTHTHKHTRLTCIKIDFCLSVYLSLLDSCKAVCLIHIFRCLPENMIQAGTDPTGLTKVSENTKKLCPVGCHGHVHCKWTISNIVPMNIALSDFENSLQYIKSMPNVLIMVFLYSPSSKIMSPWTKLMEGEVVLSYFDMQHFCNIQWISVNSLVRFLWVLIRNPGSVTWRHTKWPNGDQMLCKCSGEAHRERWTNSAVLCFRLRYKCDVALD